MSTVSFQDNDKYNQDNE